MATLSFDPLTYEDIPEDERPSLVAALVPVFGMLLFLGVGAIALDLDPQLPLLVGIAFTGAVGRYWYGTSWGTMYEGFVDGLRMGMQAILVVLGYTGWRVTKQSEDTTVGIKGAVESLADD